MTPTARKVAPLLFGSGFCALIYQTTWMREFRLIFGASTAASAAVLAIFIGGLGVGGVLLGRRVDAHKTPLFFYGQLEALVAVAAAVTPALFFAIRAIYVALGGTMAMGLGLGTVVRIVLSAVVLAVPTLAMGGTLPAAARAVESHDDGARRSVALLYGVNTLGAVTGCLLSTFLLLEVFGSRITLWMAALVNLLVAVIAVRLARELDDEPEAAQASDGDDQPSDDGPLPPASFVLTASGVVGFSFFLLELVWYRLLGPILGGTVFTFGLILAIALLGIGLGGGAYALWGSRRTPSLSAFALTCLLEALAVAFPFALGDDLAFVTLKLRSLGHLGFWGHVAGWAAVAGVVVFPAAFVSGVQFPMLMALLGKGRVDVGKQVGLLYAYNTIGAMIGSFGGGFGLIPALSAPGCWRAVGAVLALLGLAAAVLSALREGKRPANVGQLLLVALVAVLLTRQGPTATTRHSSIGVGRADTVATKSPNERIAFAHSKRAQIMWEADGIESGVAMVQADDISFFVNGKSDGSARTDASTQVMAGLVGAALRPEARTAAVVGLGTGSTSGWLAAVPAIERVDTIELEPLMRRVALDCADVNHQALDNPKLKLHIGDAREMLLASKHRYDLVVSEPSNPYRAGIASLFTVEFYEAVEKRLSEQGLFLQWVQGYEIDAQTVRTVYATLRKVFPHVESWVLERGDLLLVASRKPVPIDEPSVRRHLREEPLASALDYTWGASDLEGFLSHFLARSTLADAIAKEEGDTLNTDDLSPVEFGFARGLAANGEFSPFVVRRVARARSEHRPDVIGQVDWARVDTAILDYEFFHQAAPTDERYYDEPMRERGRAYVELLGGNTKRSLQHFKAPADAPLQPTERLFLAEALADEGDEAAIVHIDALAARRPADADILRARFATRRGRDVDAVEPLVRAFDAMRRYPWVSTRLGNGAFTLTNIIGRAHQDARQRLREALARPFAAGAYEAARRASLTELAMTNLEDPACIVALKPYEPHVPWSEQFLTRRLACYQRHKAPLEARAREDLEAFARNTPIAFDLGLLPATQPAR